MTKAAQNSQAWEAKTLSRELYLGRPYTGDIYTDFGIYGKTNQEKRKAGWGT